ncbi:MAG: type II toxin-antitoxin system RelE/ParE family toxin [Alphaproteobacteria bacterium]|nr:type II toxin-antitoxin system RelE/ParE family toxin [Alphaproteobacteria bacterium]
MKPVVWLGTSHDAVRGFSGPVRRDIGYALYAAQRGGIDPSAKPLSGFGGRGVVEVIADDTGGTYRAVYTVRFEEAIYVLHAFQKKSRKGIATSAADIEMIKKRLKLAEAEHRLAQAAKET